MATDAKIVDKTIPSATSEPKEISEDEQPKTSSNEQNKTQNCAAETQQSSEDNNQQNVSNEEGTSLTTTSDTQNVSHEEPPMGIRINNEVYNFLKNLLNETESTTQLEIALQFLTTGESQDENLPNALTNLINNLIEVAPQYIRFPNPEEATIVQQYFHTLGERKYHIGFPNVLGIIDCTHINIQTPSTRPEIYLNRNSNHSINVQIVCGPDLQIYNVLAAFPGGMEAACIWQCSNLHQVYIESDLNNGWLLGDSNYPQEPWIMTPLNNPKTPGEKLYNKVHNRTWMAIKKCIELLRSRFGCLQSVLNYEPKYVCGIVTACCVLHNICVQFRDNIQIDPAIKQAHSADIRQIMTVDSMEEGVVARDDLVQNYFSK